ncbi:MAG TPA: Ig-like domain-containing protein [Nitrososphaera sp.]|nr:Ig-like domain-containing protein [Nitrososphaera sp.]
MDLKPNFKNNYLSLRSLPRFYDHRLVSSTMAIITIALLLLPSQFSLFSFYVNSNDFVAIASPSTTQQESMSSELPSPQIEDEVDVSADNFNLPGGYVIQPFLSNLSLPTSIAIDSSNGTIYVAESIQEYDNSSSIVPLSTSSESSSSPSSFSSTSLQGLPQVRIIEAATGGDDDNTTISDQSGDFSSDAAITASDKNTTILLDNVLNWPVIDMEVDDATGLLYAFHDPTTLWKINTTSGEREDILVMEEEEQQKEAAAVASDQYGEEQQDPLSLLINSSSQIALSGKESYYDEDTVNDRYNDAPARAVLYIPCINGTVDTGYSAYCVLGLPVDGSGNTIAEANSGINSPYFILENMTSRPTGIAVLSSSYAAVSSPSSSSSSMSEQQQQQQQIAPTPTGNQTLDSFGDNNHTELLIIGSQPNYNSIFSPNNNNDNTNQELTSISYRAINYSTDAALSGLSTIYRANIFGSSPYQTVTNDNLPDIVNNNDLGNSSNSNYQLPALTPSIEPLIDYPNDELGKVAVVLVPPAAEESSSNSNNETEIDQSPSIDEDAGDDEDAFSSTLSSSSSSHTFGLNKTSAFITDFGNFSAAPVKVPSELPKIMMLDVQTGIITPFLTLNSPDSNFVPIDIAFDYNNSALYVLSSGNNQEQVNEDTGNFTTNSNNNNGMIWKISYQGEEQEVDVSTNSSSISNSTSDDDVTSDETNSTSTDSLSSNDTDSSSNSSSTDSDGVDDDSLSSEEDSDEGGEQSDADDTTDDDTTDDDNESEDTDNSSDPSSDEDTDDDGSNGSSPPPTQPTNNAPIAEDDIATTDQGTPVIINVLANDMDTEDGNSLTLDSVDEISIQGGNVRVINRDSNDDGGTTEVVEYAPAEGFFGTDEFTYTIADNNGATDSAKVTVTVNQIVLAPHPISYWLENENDVTQNLLERAAENHDVDSDNNWSFNLGNFRVPVEFDVSGNENDTKGIFETYLLAGGGEEEENNNRNAYDELAAQLLASKLNIENGVSTCEPVATTIEDSDTVLTGAVYNGPGSAENPTGESREHTLDLIATLDSYNNNDGSACE